jgi:molecular chaperone GrpE
MVQKQKSTVSAKKKAPVRKKKAKPDQSNLIGELKDSLEQEKDKYLRLFAEFENFKKRTLRERVELFKTAGQEVMSSLLPVLDDFDRATSQVSKGGNEKDIEGFILIKNKFDDILKSNGLEETKTKIGDAFDAEIHEAITQIPAQDDSQKGKIIDIVEKGYQLGKKIIRYPKVVVGQ